MLHDYELLTQDDNFIWSNRVLRNIQEREAKFEAKSEAGRLGGIKSGISRRIRSKTKQCFEANEANETMLLIGLNLSALKLHTSVQSRFFYCKIICIYFNQRTFY